MNNLYILDCTLRDGGYINHWKFEKEVISGIVSHLTAANIDIIECGFLRDITYRDDVSIFSCVSQISPFITPKNSKIKYVAMIALGDISLDKIPPYDGTSIDGIRLTFHKHEWEVAKVTAKILIQKGYKTFIQPVGTTSYSDSELLELIEDVNQLQPYAFYLVDTLGILYRHDLLRLFYLIDHNLDSSIAIGFHSHNNLQLSFANAQELMRINTLHDIIIDSSVYGMGRGVGNLSTELLAEYINSNLEYRYQISPLLDIADQYLMSIYAEQRWGYDLPYFLSAIDKCHPNYATYLIEKETLNIRDISKILSLLPDDKRDLYHPELIENLYLTLQDCQIDDSKTLDILRDHLQTKQVLVLAPGSTLRTYRDTIVRYIQEVSPYIIGVNFVTEEFPYDMLFISNRKRLGTIRDTIGTQYLVVGTSNLLNELEGNIWFLNYSSYLGEGQAADNVGAMLLRLLGKLNITQVALAGFDGFSIDSTDNYYISSYKSVMERQIVEEKNENISRQLKNALNGVKYKWITPTRYRIT